MINSHNTLVEMVNIIKTFYRWGCRCTRRQTSLPQLLQPAVWQCKRRTCGYHLGWPYFFYSFLHCPQTFAWDALLRGMLSTQIAEDREGANEFYKIIFACLRCAVILWSLTGIWTGKFHAAKYLLFFRGGGDRRVASPVLRKHNQPAPQSSTSALHHQLRHLACHCTG